MAGVQQHDQKHLAFVVTQGGVVVAKDLARSRERFARTDSSLQKPPGECETGAESVGGRSIEATNPAEFARASGR